MEAPLIAALWRVSLALSGSQKLTGTCGIVYIDMKAGSHLSQARASIHGPSQFLLLKLDFSDTAQMNSHLYN